MPTKADLRRTYRARREAFDPTALDAASDRVRSRVLALPEIAAAKCVFVYASADGEVQTYTLIEDLWAMRKTVAVPRVTDPANGGMDAVPIRSLKDLAPAAFGVLAPRHGAPLNQNPEVVVVPGVAFCPATGHRLGQGRGFYDRYLAAHPAAFAVGLSLESQLLDDLPAESHDWAVDAVVTESAVYRVTPSPAPEAPETAKPPETADA
ncbi:MAG: 5-formyltetrahydrofolate cyclo-ligase [Planctomycetota bacterium]